jgi:hypothetical protein
MSLLATTRRAAVRAPRLSRTAVVNAPAHEYVAKREAIVHHAAGEFIPFPVFSEPAKLVLNRNHRSLAQDQVGRNNVSNQSVLLKIVQFLHWYSSQQVF